MDVTVGKRLCLSTHYFLIYFKEVAIFIDILTYLHDGFNILALVHSSSYTEG